MGVFTLDASDIKGHTGKFAYSHQVWIGPWNYHIMILSWAFLVSFRLARRTTS